jgi:hypothetical protein
VGRTAGNWNRRRRRNSSGRGRRSQHDRLSWLQLGGDRCIRRPLSSRQQQPHPEQLDLLQRWAGHRPRRWSRERGGRKVRADGSNTLQNKPALTSAETTGIRTTIEGRLNSTPNRTFTIRFFSTPVFSPAGYEDKNFLGSKSVTTDENGDVPFTRQMAVAVRTGQALTATATGPGGNTSEFSGAWRVVQQ